MSSTAIRGTGLGRPGQVFFAAPNYVNASTLGSTGVILPMSSGANFVRLCSNVDFWVKWGSSAVSTAAAADGTGSELVPAGGLGIFRELSSAGTTMISALSTAAAGTLTQSWWS